MLCPPPKKKCCPSVNGWRHPVYIYQEAGYTCFVKTYYKHSLLPDTSTHGIACKDEEYKCGKVHSSEVHTFSKSALCILRTYS